MRLLIVCAIVAAGMLAVAVPARAGEGGTTAGEGGTAAAEASDKPTVEVVITFPGGAQMEGTLLQATKDGTLTVRTAGGTQEFRRQEWYTVQPKRRPEGLATGRALLAKKTQDAYKLAAQNFQKVYDDYAHLYIFGAEALDGKAQAESGMNQFTQAASTYKQLLSEYSGADITAERRYNYAQALMKVGGADNRAEAIAQLDRVVDATDDIFTMQALNALSGLHYDNKDYYLALRASLQVLILYGGYSGQDITEARKQLKLAKGNALDCCDKLSKSSNAEMKRRVARIQARVSRMPF